MNFEEFTQCQIMIIFVGDLPSQYQSTSLCLLRELWKVVDEPDTVVKNDLAAGFYSLPDLAHSIGADEVVKLQHKPLFRMVPTETFTMKEYVSSLSVKEKMKNSSLRRKHYNFFQIERKAYKCH